MIWQGIVLGLVGTLVFDLWNLLAERVFAIRAPNWSILGKWMLAPFTTDRRRITPATVFTPAQRYLGAAAHYAVGAAFGLGLVLIMGPQWLERPTVASAVAAGVVTTLPAWLIIMPALGHGIAGTRLPTRNKIRAATLISHAIMGLGFYLGALLLLAGIGQ